MFDEYFAMRSTLWALLVVLGACTKPNPASCLDDFCDDPALPFCDVDGAIGGVPDTCIAVQCTPDEFQGCRDDSALICSADGQNINELACEFGCGDDGCLPCNTADCQPPEKHAIPKYLPDVCNDLATTSLAIDADVTLDTGDDANCTSVSTQTSGPEICVIHHEAISIAANITLRFKGPRVVALVADRGLEVAGILDISASHNVFPGPGGGIVRSGASGTNGGGGGAGFRTAGASGGIAGVDGGGANGGEALPPQQHPALSTQLFGGTQPAGGAAMGQAGGAATLICCRCTTSVTGLIDAGGGGGQRGNLGAPNPSRASGGGSGGVVVLQGLGVSVSGQAFANGGGGGAGNSGSAAVDGEDGPRSTSCAAGGPVGGGGGAGGRGGCGFSGPTVGLKMPGTATAVNLAGAGGGSAGFLLVYTPSGVTPTLSPFAVSPDFEPNGVIPTN